MILGQTFLCLNAPSVLERPLTHYREEWRSHGAYIVWRARKVCKLGSHDMPTSACMYYEPRKHMAPRSSTQRLRQYWPLLLYSPHAQLSRKPRRRTMFVPSLEARAQAPRDGWLDDFEPRLQRLCCDNPLDPTGSTHETSIRCPARGTGRLEGAPSVTTSPYIRSKFARKQEVRKVLTDFRYDLQARCCRILLSGKIKQNNQLQRRQLHVVDSIASLAHFHVFPEAGSLFSG